MHQSPVEKIPYEGHPNQCQTVKSQGQCPNLGLLLPDGTYALNCKVHGGSQQATAWEKHQLRNYRLTKWQARLHRHTTSDNIKSLRDEVGILRMMMEERLNRVEDAHDLVLQSAPISDLVMKIDRVVTSCHKLEGAMGQLLDKQALLNFASGVIGIVGDVVTDPEQVDQIANRILTLVGGNDDNES